VRLKESLKKKERKSERKQPLPVTNFEVEAARWLTLGSEL
jgi:hypothetical protein